MHRPQFPERIPFRLTRMLVKAMEASGFEGSFRNTSENVMRVLRENKESVMAVLEAFVYDPLINWRILNTQQQPPAEQAQGRTGGAVANGGTTNGAANGGTVKALVAESFPKDQARSLRRPLPSEQELVNETVDGKAHVFAACLWLMLCVGRVLNSFYSCSLCKTDMQPEQLNQRAVTVLNRITNKLTGRDFNPDQTLDVHSQVEKLIRQATSTENLCQCWVGYCAFW